MTTKQFVQPDDIQKWFFDCSRRSCGKKIKAEQTPELAAKKRDPQPHCPVCRAAMELMKRPGEASYDPSGGHGFDPEPERRIPQAAYAWKSPIHFEP